MAVAPKAVKVVVLPAHTDGVAGEMVGVAGGAITFRVTVEMALHPPSVPVTV